MKKYENPMLQIVSINKNDIIVTSPTANPEEYYDPNNANFSICAPGRRVFDSWDAGY